MRLTLRTVAGIAALAFGLTAVVAASQTMTPPATGPGMKRASHIEYGGFLYKGTCDKLQGDPVEHFGDLEVDHDEDEPLIVATPAAGPVASEDEDVSQSIDELTGNDYAIVVRQSEDPASPVVACGEIAGNVENGALTIDLHDVNGSGVSGVARLTRDRDDNETDVLIQVVTASPASTPETASSPAA